MECMSRCNKNIYLLNGYNTWQLTQCLWTFSRTADMIMPKIENVSFYEGHMNDVK